MTLGRRDALRLLVLGGAASPLVGACASVSPATTPRPTGRRLARVLVQADRVIRQVAGLRPYRPSGFNVSVESIAGKPVIHNYGHGGGGITLSWGTANLVLEHALAMQHRDAAVLGAGAVGLATARLLQDHGFAVTIYARDLPPNTTSNIAGASWGPSSVFDPERRTPVFDEQFSRAARFAFRYFQNLVGPRYSISWRENYSLSENAPSGQRTSPVGLLLAGLRPPSVTLPPGEHPFGALHATRSLTMHIEPASYLQQLLTDFQAIGGRIVVREFKERQAIGEVAHPLVVNCTGLGARDLFGDAELSPIKGQLTVLAPQVEVDYLTTGPGDLYMMPRRDGIVLGGTHEADVWSLEPNPTEATRIFQGHQRLFGRML
jgi:glycine/D-amino acid oxidase-like deaminating enzyme